MKLFSILSRRKILTFVALACILMLLLFGIYSRFQLPSICMTSRNFTTILKDVHDNAYEYSGETIKFSGYLYKAPDFKQNQFVIARNMKVSESDYRIVGFLCESDDWIEDIGTWVNAKGIVTLGDYHGPMPIIKILKIQKAKKPKNITVKPPTSLQTNL